MSDLSSHEIEDLFKRITPVLETWARDHKLANGRSLWLTAEFWLDATDSVRLQDTRVLVSPGFALNPSN